MGLDCDSSTQLLLLTFCIHLWKKIDIAGIMNGTFASPTADAKYAVFTTQDEGLLARLYGGVSAWSIVLTFFLMLVVYDQGMCY